MPRHVLTYSVHAAFRIELRWHQFSFSKVLRQIEEMEVGKLPSERLCGVGRVVVGTLLQVGTGGRCMRVAGPQASAFCLACAPCARPHVPCAPLSSQRGGFRTARRRSAGSAVPCTCAQEGMPRASTVSMTRSNSVPVACLCVQVFIANS